MTANSNISAPILPPPRSEAGALGWARANLFGSAFNAVLTVVSLATLAAALFFGLRWILLSADWSVVATVGGRFVIGSYNSDQACPGNNCFWRPQVSLLLVTFVLGVAWGVVGGGVNASVSARILSLVRSATRTLGWARANLFSSKFKAVLTILALALLSVALIGLLRVLWNLVATEGGRFVLMAFLLVIVWGVIGGGMARRMAILTAFAAAAFAFLPYGMERMGMDVRLLLAANLPMVFGGWALARFTPLGSARAVIIMAVAAFGLTLFLMLGYDIAGDPGWFRPVDVRHWGGLTLNLILACAGITLSLPIGIALALGRRSHLPVLKTVCVGFIEVLRGVPLITLLFMSQHIVPLAFPETFPRNSLVNAGVVITLFSSAYMAENIRGGLQALHPGQAEAARALGLPGWQTTLLISLPQAIRNVIPAIVGQFIGLFKDTSLVYIIGMLDMVEVGRVTITGRPEYQGTAQEMFIFIALVFWVFTYGMSYISRRVERNLGVGER